MSILKELEINRLFREFEYLQSDFSYKSQIIREADVCFLQEIDNLLNMNNELKTIYKQKVEKKFSKTISDKLINDNVGIDIEDYVENKSSKIKKIYYQIAKLSHPDKIKESRLNNLYIEATQFYEDNDIISLYKICDILNISYDIEESDIDLIKGNISSIKDRISFIEETFSWKWYNNESNRNDLLIAYIKNQII